MIKTPGALWITYGQTPSGTRENQGGEVLTIYGQNDQSPIVDVVHSSIINQQSPIASPPW
jgi:hypothetical protein